MLQCSWHKHVGLCQHIVDNICVEEHIKGKLHQFKNLSLFIGPGEYYCMCERKLYKAFCAPVGVAQNPINMDITSVGF